MKKLFSLLIVGSFFLSSCSEARMNIEKVANKALDTSVVIRIKVKYKTEKGKEKTVLGSCSGTFISGDRVLTAAHCFSKETVVNVWVRGTDGISFPAEVIKISPPHDLALLQVKQVSNHPYARLGRSPKVGEEILNIGSPYPFEFLTSQGIISAIHYPVSAFLSKYTITTAMINSGSSGGGLFNKKGQLVGVNTMSTGFFGWTGISMAVSIEDVKEFLK